MIKKEYTFRCLSESWENPILIYISNSQFGDAADKLKDAVELVASRPYTFCELIVNDWDQYLTPWKSDVEFKGRTFTGNAPWLLQELENNIVPFIRQKSQDAKIYIAGYSLAGLFSIWSLYESNLFAGAACCSGSLWYPGWREYSLEYSLNHSCSVYLSLGKKEKNTKHPLMKNVEDNMILEYELLKEDPFSDRIYLDMNEGGHFDNTIERMVMGISKLLNLK